MAVKFEDSQREDRTELERFGRCYDEGAQVAGLPAWRDLPEQQRLVIALASRRCHASSDEPERLLTVKDMVRLSGGMGRNTISRWCHDGTLPARMIAGAYRVPTSAWNALMRDGLLDGNGKVLALRRPSR